MPVRFARLRIAGFKSFAEPVSVEIMPGLTGIVGPNGCGKSNVVEALRWAMGEASAKSLRGGEMEDVIFAGSGARASRNIAEVTLTLEDAEGAAPPPFQELGELQISRRIERGNGSTYRINGREARARDVQTLFADLASGAQSSAMVGQGRVGALIAARPEARRLLLEEAAGITGLHARRHEATLKLRAAEANLARADDLRLQLEQQHASLSKQAKQARRYAEMATLVRAAESELLALQHAVAESAVAESRAALAVAQEAVEGATQDAAEAATAAATAQTALPPLREAEAEARTALERHRILAGQIDADRARAVAAVDMAAKHLAQLGQDLTHATQLAEDARREAETLSREDARLAERDAAHPEEAETAATALAAARTAVAETEAAAQRATQAEADARAAHEAARAALHRAEQAASRLAERRDAAVTERDRLHASLVPADRLAAAEQEAADATALRDQAAAALDTAMAARQCAQAAQAEARDRDNAAEAIRAGLAAEAGALRDVLAADAPGVADPVVDAVRVPPGLEAALAAALADTITAGTTADSARHWRALPPLEPAALPEGAAPLATLIAAPPALARALAHVGLCEDGKPLHPMLAPGQSLVSRDGGLWRWDGYVAAPGTPNPAAVRLRQRNRLAEVSEALRHAEITASEARRSRETADQNAATAAASEQDAHGLRRAADADAIRAQATAQRLRAEATDAANRFALADAQAGRLAEEAGEAARTLADAHTTADAAPDPAAHAAEVAEARARLAAARDAERVARDRTDTIAREATARAARRAAIATEAAQWHGRAETARARVADLAARRAEAEAEHTALLPVPAQLLEQQETIAAALAESATAHRDSAATLARAAAEADTRAAAQRAAEAALATSRESAIRADAAAGQAESALAAVAARITERLGDTPLPPPAPPDAEDKLRRKLERLVRERDDMGPVNHRAETETAEIAERLDTLNRERDEIAAAVAKLLGSLDALNREGRDRLGTVFAAVDRHFQALFTRMFGGGKAHLALVGSDDPLEAGLEVYAQPPGKKLASLSLLSGGEQALTALSLIFAVFRCNPAPVCVLDEVDAPLDDANVDRFCLLLEDMVRETETRFLVVTHHPVTMARMDRLYGVTMQERGISRLLSVDLARATVLVEAPRMAAE